MKRSQALSLAPVLAFLLLGSGPVLAVGQAADKDVAALMDAYLAAGHKLDRFSGTVLIAQKGKIVLSKGYGMANYELDVPNTPETKFRLGSVTKQFTAMAILHLQEQGKLKVKDTIGGPPRLSRRREDHHPPPADPHFRHPQLHDYPDYIKTQPCPRPTLQTVESFKNRPSTSRRARGSATATRATSCSGPSSRR